MSFIIATWPYNAIPSNLLYNLKQLGLPTQAHSLQTVSIAARARNALFTLTTYKENITMLQLQQTHDSAILNPPLQPWIDNSITMHLHRAVLRTQPLLTQITDTNPQRQLAKLLLPQTHTQSTFTSYSPNAGHGFS